MEIYIPDKSLQRAFLCDIDGTVANHEEIRGHYEYEKVLQDKPISHIINIVESLSYNPWYPVFVSGRFAECLVDTVSWLHTHMPFLSQGYELYMRTQGDYRPDYVIKSEIFDSHIRHRYCVEFAIDDRNQVVDMWREADIPCLQVAPGDF